MGLLDALFQSDSYGGQGGGLLDLIRQTQNNQYQPSAGFPADAPPASFADRFSALPGAPPAFNPAPRQMDNANFDPSTYAPNQAAPIAVGSYQMPRMGGADQFQAQQAMLPPNAQPTQGQFPPQAPQQSSTQQPEQSLPPALQQPTSSGGFGGAFRGMAANMQAGPLGMLMGAIGGAAGMGRGDPQDIARQNLAAQYHAVRQTLIQSGTSPQEANSKAMLAVMNPEAGKTILQEALTNREKFGEIGSDSFGNKTMGFINERDQTINGKPIGAHNGATSSTGFLAPGVKQIDSTLQGQDYLKQFSPEVQAAVQNYIDGKSTPTGNPRKGFTQTVKMIAQKVGADTGQSVDDASFAARKTMRNQLSSSAPSSLGGQINIGNTAAGHLADLSQKAIELGNVDTGIAPLTSLVNSARGLGTEQAAKMEALKGAAQHYGQEITKFYAGSPGGTAERDRFIESVNGARSPKELAAILATEGELMRSRLDALGGQIKGVLGEEGAKQYPVLRADGQAALAKVEENVSKLKGGQSTAPTIQEGATATNPKTGQKITFTNGKWQ
jgi:hypothetical protein